jgi:cell division protein FtsW (lipid II flippase)
MAIAEQSLLSFGYQLITSFDTAQVVFDLYIMAFLAICWMYRDSQIRRKSKWYFISFTVLTLVFVAIGPLLYLVLNPIDVDKKNRDRDIIEE